MRFSNNNLGVTLRDYKETWERSHLSNGKECKYHDKRFSEGWIPLATAPFYPALNRFEGNNNLAREIIEALETKGEYKFGRHTPSELEPALK